MATDDITGSVEATRPARPQIYAYTTPEIARHDGWTKIGYTEQDVVRRIEQQTHTADVRWNLEWHGDAVYNDGSGETFKDKAFHRYLGWLDVRNEPDTEWFEISGQDSLTAFEDFRDSRGRLDMPETVEYSLRAEQGRAVEETVRYFEGHNGGEFLWNAKPRFGKTITSYDLMRSLGARRVLVVTNRPAIANSWYDDYVKFVGLDSGYHFVSRVAALAGRPHVESREEYKRAISDPSSPKGIVEFVSLQDLKGSVYFGGAHDKLSEVAELEWDLLVIDEAHEGVDTYKTDVAFDQVRRRFTLHLSGTPFKALANEKFPEDAIYNWTYADEQQAKRDWDDPELPNPYGDLPRLNLFTYQMGEAVFDEARRGTTVEGDDAEFAFDLNEFFATDGSGRFTHDAEVDRFLDSLSQNTKYPFSTPELRDQLRHTFWMLNRVDSARALAKKLAAHPLFRDYKVVLAAGDGRLDDGEENARALDRVREAIAGNDRTITLSVGQLTTGVTVPEWTAVLMLSNMKSPALYMQAAFRAQNPCLFRDGDAFYRKENAYVFDFDPARTLTIVEEFANDLYADGASGAAASDTRKERVRRLLNFLPVLAEDDQGEMVELDAERVLSIPRKIRSQEVVRRGFMSDFLFQNISNIFHAPSEVIDIVSGFEAVKEPKAHRGPVGIDGGTAEELDINADGEVEVPREKVIGTAAGVFGEKLYETIEAELDEQVREVTSRVSADGDKDLADELARAFKGSVVDPLVGQATASEYTAGLRPREVGRIRKRVEADADRAIRREVGDFVVRSNVIERDREEALASASDDAERAAVNREHDRRAEEALGELEASLREAREGLVRGAAETVVREVETTRREARKSELEASVRDHLRGFSRTIPAFLMAYGDEGTTLARFDEVIPDDVFREVTGITVDQFRFLRDGGDFTDPQTGEVRHFGGRLFDPVVFDDSVREFMRLRSELADYFDPDQDGDIFDYIPNQRTNQIFTPKALVRDMVDRFEQENPGCFDDPGNTFADLYMKSGLYIAEVVKRLFRSEAMAEAIPDEGERLRHIFESQVFGIAPSEIIHRIATHYLMGFDGGHGRDWDVNFCVADSAALAKEGRLAEFVEERFGAKM